jgi:hypothetical protein
MEKNVIIGEDLSGHGLSLHCPSCGGHYTHIYHVDILRPRDKGRGEIDIVLTIDCEGCSIISKLGFRHHEGQTEIETDSTFDPCKDCECVSCRKKRCELYKTKNCNPTLGVYY